MDTTSPTKPTITKRELAEQAMQANRSARLKASERGGPETEMEIMLSPSRHILIGENILRPMSAGIAELMRIRRLVEVEFTPEEMIFCFAEPERAYKLLAPVRGNWKVLPDEWRAAVFSFSLWLEKDRLEAASQWVKRELEDFFGSPEENPPEVENQQQVDVKGAEPDGGCDRLKESSPITDTASPPGPIPSNGPSGSSLSTGTSP